MKHKSFRERFLPYLSGMGGGASIAGAHNVCHTVCVGAIAVLSAIGITVSGMPLMWLQKYNVWFWLMGLAFLVPMLYMYFKHKGCMTSKPLLANAGLLIAGIPFTPFQPYTAVLWVVGGVLVAASIVLFVKEKMVLRAKQTKKKENQDLWKVLLVGGIVLVLGLFAFNIYLMGQVKSLQKAQAQVSPQVMMMGRPMSRMSFSEFDKSLAIEFMDKNGDGKCDSCGMDIDQCIASGMLQCSMDPDSTIGTLGSQHIHTDWKIYINGKPFDWSPFADRHQRQMMGDTSIKDTSAFIHIHPAQAPEQAGDILHMHATGVPLSMFFESLGMKFTKECLTLSESEKYCTDEKNSLKFYVNGKTNDQYGDYVFNDLDKILISYGPKNEDVSGQLASITNFAGAH